jgi:hypothetical protein
VNVDSPEDLYGLPLDRFVPARAALVKTLRGEKRRDQASEVAALRKPSVAAWAVNQLVRTQPKGLQALLEAGDELARAQAQAAAGKRGAGDALRGASHRQRDAMRVLLQAAEGLLSSGGQALSQATMERVSETLRAAAVDEEARRQVAGGCLTQELRFAGVGIGGSAPTSTESVPGAKPISTKDKAHRRGTDTGLNRRPPADESAAGAREAKAARDAEAEREAARQQAAALKAARRTEAEARRAATRAHTELAAAQVRHETAAASLHEAEAVLSAAADRATDAAARLTAAEQALRDLDQP